MEVFKEKLKEMDYSKASDIEFKRNKWYCVRYTSPWKVQHSISKKLVTKSFEKKKKKERK